MSRRRRMKLTNVITFRVGLLSNVSQYHNLHSKRMKSCQDLKHLIDEELKKPVKASFHNDKAPSLISKMIRLMEL